MSQVKILFGYTMFGSEASHYLGSQQRFYSNEKKTIQAK
jgi:hypothetical protein